MARAERQNGAQASLEQRIVARLRVGHAIAVAEGERTLADALEHDDIELTLGDQLDRRVEPVSREPGAGAETDGVRLGHLQVSLSPGPSGREPGASVRLERARRGTNLASGRW